MELVARSIHCIAASIDKLAEKAHIGNIREAIDFVQPGRVIDMGTRTIEMDSTPALKHLFFSFNYMNVKDYPFGVSDMAGYWAEDRIFGGVVLFDRGESGKEVWTFTAPICFAVAQYLHFWYEGQQRVVPFREAQMDDACLEAAGLAIGITHGVSVEGF